MSEELISQNVVSIFKAEKPIIKPNEKHLTIKQDSSIITFLDNGSIHEITKIKEGLL